MRRCNKDFGCRKACKCGYFAEVCVEQCTIKPTSTVFIWTRANSASPAVHGSVCMIMDGSHGQRFETCSDLRPEHVKFVSCAWN